MDQVQICWILFLWEATLNAAAMFQHVSTVILFAQAFPAWLPSEVTLIFKRTTSGPSSKTWMAPWVVSLGSSASTNLTMRHHETYLVRYVHSFPKLWPVAKSSAEQHWSLRLRVDQILSISPSLEEHITQYLSSVSSSSSPLSSCSSSSTSWSSSCGSSYYYYSYSSS